MSTAPVRLRLNHRAPSGDWTVEKKAIALNESNGRVAYRFHARDLHLVMGPAARESSVRFGVLINGQPPGTAHGNDVDDEGNGKVIEQRLYQLIRQRRPIAGTTALGRTKIALQTEEQWHACAACLDRL